MDLHDPLWAPHGGGQTHQHHFLPIARRPRALLFRPDSLATVIDRHPLLLAHSRCQRSGYPKDLDHLRIVEIEKSLLRHETMREQQPGGVENQIKRSVTGQRLSRSGNGFLPFEINQQKRLTVQADYCGVFWVCLQPRSESGADRAGSIDYQGKNIVGRELQRDDSNTRSASCLPLSQAPSTLPPLSQSPHRPRPMSAFQAHALSRTGSITSA